MADLEEEKGGRKKPKEVYIPGAEIILAKENITLLLQMTGLWGTRSSASLSASLPALLPADPHPPGAGAGLGLCQLTARAPTSLPS